MASVSAGVPSASAQEPAPPAAAVRRTFGLGVGSSTGVLFGRTRTLELTKIEWGLVDVNLFLPVTPRVTLQAWVPVSYLITETKLDRPMIQFALLARIHPLAGSGFYLGSGLDLALVKAGGDDAFNFAPRIPLAVGYETGVDEQSGFGFTMALRPAVGFVADTNAGSAAAATTYGFAWSLLVEFDVTGYFKEQPAPATPPPPPPSS